MEWITYMLRTKWNLQNYAKWNLLNHIRFQWDVKIYAAHVISIFLVLSFIHIVKRKINFTAVK